MITVTIEKAMTPAKSGEPMLVVRKVKLFGLTIHKRIMLYMDGGQIKK